MSLEGDMISIPRDKLIATMIICGAREENIKGEMMKMDRPSTKRSWPKQKCTYVRNKT